MFSNFYNSSIRRYIVMMMELFGNIEVRRHTREGMQVQRVPITYAKKEKFVSMLNRVNMPLENDTAKVEKVLPILTLSLYDMTYNGTKKTNISNHRVKTLNDGKMIQQFNPVPYDFWFELSAHARHEDDIFQIIEQILPYFQPHFNVKITELYNNQVIVENQDIKVVLNSVMMDEDATGDPRQRRRIQWTLTFSFTGWLYPDTKDLTNIIKTVYLNFHAEQVEVSDGKQFETIEQIVKPDGVAREEWTGEFLENYETHNKEGE